MHVQLHDLRDAQVAQRLSRPLDCGGGRLLPGLGAGPDQLDHFIDALCHFALLSLRQAGLACWQLGQAAGFPSSRRRADFCEIITGLREWSRGPNHLLYRRSDVWAAPEPAAGRGRYGFALFFPPTIAPTAVPRHVPKNAPNMEA